MRIVLAAATPSVVGGAEAWAATIVSGLRRAGHDVALLHERDTVQGRERVVSDGPTFCSASELVPEGAVKFAPDVLLVNGLASPALERRLLERWPAVLYAHAYYGTCATGTKRFAWPSVEACTRSLGVSCLVRHYPRRCGGLDPRTMLSDYRRQRSRSRILRDYKRVIIASKHMFAEYRRSGVEPSRLVLAPCPAYGVKRPPLQPSVPKQTGKILFLGRLAELKGPHHAVRAARIAAATLGRELSVTIAGDGPYRSRVAAIADDLGVKLNSPGWVHGTSRSGLFSSHELLAMPSLWPEPFGMAGIEAGAHGLPAVAYDTGGISDWLAAGVSGELAPSNPPTVEGLADAIVRALADPNHYARLSRGAWEIADRFDEAAHIRCVEGVLCEAASS